MSAELEAVKAKLKVSRNKPGLADRVAALEAEIERLEALNGS